MMVISSTVETCIVLSDLCHSLVIYPFSFILISGGHPMLHVIGRTMSKVQCPFNYGDNLFLRVIVLHGFHFYIYLGKQKKNVSCKLINHLIS